MYIRRKISQIGERRFRNPRILRHELTWEARAKAMKGNEQGRGKAYFEKITKSEINLLRRGLR